MSDPEVTGAGAVPYPQDREKWWGVLDEGIPRSQAALTDRTKEH